MIIKEISPYSSIVFLTFESIFDTTSIQKLKIVFSHETALFLNGLSERTPFSHTVTIPSNTALPNSIKKECNCYYIKPELHQIGVIWKKTTLGNEVRCYDEKRTICDLLRSRTRIDSETLIGAIKNYAALRNKDLYRLAAYAEKLYVYKYLKQYMKVLL